LNDVSSASVGGALFELHCLVAYDAAYEMDQRAFIVVVRRTHFPFAFMPQGARVDLNLQKVNQESAARLLNVSTRTSPSLHSARKRSVTQQPTFDGLIGVSIVA
jgi:hypothetical protein